MKKLLFILSCVLSLCSCTHRENYQTSQIATLEELDGYNATLVLKDSSKVVKVKLTDTLDCYAKTPLKAEGQRVILYNANSISQVDQNFIIRKTETWNLGKALLIILGLVTAGTWLYVDNSSTKIFIVSLGISIFFTGMFFIYTCNESQYKIVSYGEITHIDRLPGSDLQKVVIKTENNTEEDYQISSSMFNVLDNRAEKKECIIYKVKEEYGIYQNQDRDENILKSTIEYLNEKYASIQKVLLYLMLASLSIAFISFIRELIVKSKK